MTWLVSLLGQLPGFRVRALFVSLFLELGAEAAKPASPALWAGAPAAASCVLGRKGSPAALGAGVSDNGHRPVLPSTPYPWARSSVG